jgi:16S rRNA (guanine527-N7)-methyltransferase
MSIFADTLMRSLSEAGIEYEQAQIKLCEEYFKLVYEANRHMNLTRITDDAQAARQHFADSVRVLSFLDISSGSRIIDIGTGAGFPGMPVKLLRPYIEITLLDSSCKKCDFIKSAAEKLGISVTVLAARAEEGARSALRESFDFAFSKAVAPLNMLVELCSPFVRVGGAFAAWKGESYEQELAEAERAIGTLGCRVKSTHFINPGAIILIGKQKPTPDIYPRRFSKIKASPL